jgi:uncharacterized protein
MSATYDEANATTASVIESGVDVLMALLYAPGASGRINEPIKGITRLQKLLFLLWKEGRFYETLQDLYNFKAYDFGPCMDDLYDDLEFVQEMGLVNVEEVPSGNEYEGGDEDAFLRDFGFKLIKKETRRDFRLTESGCQAGKDLFDSLSAEDQDRVRKIKTKYNNMSFWSLLRYVYKKYPTFAKKSVLSI